MRFLESESDERPATDCRFHVIPAPLEVTVSYGCGTGRGPDAIIEASQQLEAYDGVGAPCHAGIYTSVAALTLDDIEDQVAYALAQAAVPVLLGGEHTVTLGALRAFSAARSETPIGVIQIDAHADLRDEYEGSRLSHACVMRRAVDDLTMPLVQIGVRAISQPEVFVRERFGITCFDAAVLRGRRLPDDWLPTGFPDRVYLTIDVDGFDPSVIPGTGTPVPGGLGWWQVCDIVEQVASACEIVGFDVVELAPLDGTRISEFAAAQLVYNTMGQILRGKGGAG